MKIPDWNDLKHGTIVVLDTLSKPIDLGVQKVKGQVHRVIISNLVPADP